MEKVLTMPIKDFRQFVIDEIKRSFVETQNVKKGCVMLNDKSQLIAFPLVMRNAMEQQIVEHVLIPDRVKEVNAQCVAVIADSTLKVENKVTDQSVIIDVVTVLIETKTSAEVIIWEIIKEDDTLILVLREDLSKLLRIAGKYLNVVVMGGASLN